MEDRIPGQQSRMCRRLVRLVGLLAALVATACLFASSAAAWGGGGQQQSSFTIEKEQRLAGESNYTKNELSGKIGETVEYKVVVRNTGSVPLSLGEFSDPNCDAGTLSGGPGLSEIGPGDTTTYTCHHVLTEVGTYSNTAYVTGTGRGCFPSTVDSNTVVVKVPVEPAAAIEKLQEIKGSGAGYTTKELTGKVGQTVDYEIIVRNTGTVPVKLSNFTDDNCTNIKGGPGSSELQPNEKTTYTCEHVLTEVGTWTNVASVQSTGNEHMCGKYMTTTLTSNTVVVKVPGEEAFKVKKEQRLGSSGSYTEAKLTGKLGETVDYLITVTDTGSLPIKLQKITDTNCTDMAGPSKTELKPGESATYTCEHKLTATGIWTNVATVETCTGKHEESNTVEVEVPETEKYEVQKLQRLAGETSYTTSPLTGKAPLTVEYEIVVTNTGKVPVHVEKITDAKVTGCETTSPKQPEVKVNEKDVVESTCSHTVTGEGETFTNIATVKTPEKEVPTEEVEVKTKTEGFKVKKEQKLAAKGSYTIEKLETEVGETVDYLITVEDTGTLPIKLEAISDPHCTNIVGPSVAELTKAGETATYTCEHVLTEKGTWKNAATVEGNKKPEKSNEVEVKAIPTKEETEDFKVEKEQRLGTSGSYTTEPLKGKVNETVDYLITVTETGSVPVKLEKLTDPNCENASGPSKGELTKEGESATYTCEHKLTEVGMWVNVATVEGNKFPKESNEVEVEVPVELNFLIRKYQKIEGSSGEFTPNALTGTEGAVVDYEIRVTNTSNATVKFEGFTDEKCEDIVEPAGASSVKPGETIVYTCKHTIVGRGDWTNAATVTASNPLDPKTLTRASNQVVVYDPAFTIEKLQRIKGAGQEFTTFELTGTVGQTVEYEIVVTNAESMLQLVFSNFSDPNCTNITGGPGATAVPPAASTTFTCEHTLTSVGRYVNVASIEANEGIGTEGPIKVPVGKKTSNEVVVNAVEAPKQAVKAVCTLSESSITLSNASGSRRKPFTVRLPALGIKQVTFYLDGHKLKTLNSSQAKNGMFSVTINPRKLSYGAHKVTVKTVMADSVCAPVARAAVFVHPRAARVSPKFTG